MFRVDYVRCDVGDSTLDQSVDIAFDNPEGIPPSTLEDRNDGRNPLHSR